MLIFVKISWPKTCSKWHILLTGSKYHRLGAFILHCSGAGVLKPCWNSHCTTHSSERRMLTSSIVALLRERRREKKRKIGPDRRKRRFIKSHNLREREREFNDLLVS